MTDKNETTIEQLNDNDSIVVELDKPTNNDELQINQDNLEETNNPVLADITNPLTESENTVAVEEIKEDSKADNNKKVKLPRWLLKVNDYLTVNWLYFSAPILIFALFMGVLLSLDIYPFGTDNMSNYDLLAQIVPFMEHFFDVFEGKSSLFYSPSIIGGADVFGTLAYCCVSPFTFLFLFFGKGTLYNAVSFVLPLKLGVVAISAIYFIKKLFKNIPEYQVLMLSLLYAFCGYMFVANTYINWVDFLIYMPFVVLGFKKLVDEKKIRYFAIAYSLMIYTCFSISCFALILVFMVFVIYALVVCTPENRWEILSKMCLSLVLTVAICLPIIVPAFVSYMVSGRNTGIFQNINRELDAGHLYAKTSYILSDTLCLFLTVVYFIKYGVKEKKNLFLLLAGILISMPIFIDEVCNLLNAGSYMSYALRFGFLNAIYMLYIACKVLNDISEKPVNKLVNAVGFFAMIGCGVFAVIFILQVNLDLMENNTYGFSGKYAHSLGGLETISSLMLVLFALLIVGLLLYKFRLISIKLVSYVLMGVLTVQVAFYNIHLVRGNQFNTLRYDEFNAAFATVLEKDKSDFRIKDVSDAISNSAALTTHTNSYAVFSSVIDETNFTPSNFFNYNGNKTNSINSSGGSFFGDCFIGYKYFFVDKNESRAAYKIDNRAYLKKLDETEQQYYCVYENVDVFPNCYTVPGKELKLTEGDYLDQLQELYTFLGGEGSAFKTVEFLPQDEFQYLPNTSQIKYDADTEIYYMTIPVSDSGQYYFDFEFENSEGIHFSTDSFSDEYKYDIDCSGIMKDYFYINYSPAMPGYVFNLCLKADNGIDFSADMIKKYVSAKILTDNAIAVLSDSLWERSCEYTSSNGTFNITAHADNGETYLFLNYSSIKGFNATVNGHKTEIIENGMDMLLVKLDEGENDVVISYTSPYFGYIGIGIVLCAVIILLLYLGYKKFPKIFQKLQFSIGIAAIVLMVGLFGFFIAYPTGVFMVKLVKYLITLF